MSQSVSIGESVGIALRCLPRLDTASVFIRHLCLKMEMAVNRDLKLNPQHLFPAVTQTPHFKT